MSDQAGEKTQDATPHRKEEARRKGQVARSQDLGSAGLLIAALAILMLMGGGFVTFMGNLTTEYLGGDAWLRADVGFFMDHYNRVMSGLTRVVLPMLGLMMLAAVLLSLVQVGFMFLPDRLAPDLSRINPMQGVKRLFSMTSVARLLFGVFKIVLIAGVAAICLYGEQEQIIGLVALDLPQIGKFLLEMIFYTSLKIGLVLLVLALLDFAFQKWKHAQDLKMTTQEVREEMKNLQGDPQVVSRRKAVQRQLVLNRLSTDVPKADVVVTNPTHLAVAIQYDPETMQAPVVVAKGAGVLAQRIRRLAVEHEIPIVEKKPLARALYAEVEVNHPVPSDQYAAVAELLAYVYQLKGKTVPGADQLAG